MAVNWQLGLMPDIGGNALAAFEQGRQRKRESDLLAAQGAYAANPNAQTLNALAPLDPKFVIQQRQVEAKQAQQQQADQLEQMPMVARLLDGITDEATFQQAKQLATRFGLPLDGVPETYDPQWVQNSKAIARVFAERPEVVSPIGKEAVDIGLQPGTPEFNAYMEKRLAEEGTKLVAIQQGGSLAAVAPGQTPQYLVVPNPGDKPVGAPAVAAVDDEWEVVGGAGGNASGGFRP